MSLSRKSANNSHSSPSLLVEMSSFNVEPKLQKVTVDSVYVTNVQTVDPKGSEILQVAKVILQLVSMVFGLYLIIFLIMTGFSFVRPAPEYIPGTSFLNVPKVRVVDSPNVPFLLSESAESDLVTSSTTDESQDDESQDDESQDDESQDDESDDPQWITFPEEFDKSWVSTQASITTSTTTEAPSASPTTLGPTANSTTSSSIASSSAAAPVRRQLPKRSPMSESFLKEFRNKTEETQLYLDEAEEYCLPGTSLADCELDWPKLRLHQALQVHYMNFSSFNANADADTYDECFSAKEEITCFGPFNGTHSEVRLNELVYKPGTLEVEFIKEDKIYPRYIIAVGPEDYILVTGETPDQFCLLTLFDHSCQTYAHMVGTMITS